ALVFVFLFARQKSRLRKMNKELQTSNNTLKNFISIIAHDLKNPFNTIIGFSDLLKTEFNSLSPKERTLAIENTHKSALNAFALLEQLLNWARLQTGTIQLEMTLIDLAELVDEVMNLLQTAAFLKKQTLINRIPTGLRVRADKNMMLAVFRNLVSNAIKFTPDEGFIEVAAIDSANTIQAVVKDTGVGISAEGIRKLFSIDELYKTAGTRGEKGTGIGLLLCKEYLEKNGGNIEVESIEGKGTTFTVTLPKAIS
ncbi:MAG: HAMP domain-containing histidine kinase, partial [Bacteroidales bacterium]|nr:HAMP domain-containing histidine kinase [Bacteroidales bacterium]